MWRNRYALPNRRKSGISTAYTRMITWANEELHAGCWECPCYVRTVDCSILGLTKSTRIALMCTDTSNKFFDFHLSSFIWNLLLYLNCIKVNISSTNSDKSSVLIGLWHQRPHPTTHQHWVNYLWFLFSGAYFQIFTGLSKATLYTVYYQLMQQNVYIEHRIFNL